MYAYSSLIVTSIKQISSLSFPARFYSDERISSTFEPFGASDISPPANIMASYQSESSSPSTSAPSSSRSACSEDDTSNLAIAVFAGNVLKVQRLINAGATTAKLHLYALFSACLHGVGMIRALLASPDTSFDVLQLGVPLLQYILLAPDD